MRTAIIMLMAFTVMLVIYGLWAWHYFDITFKNRSDSVAASVGYWMNFIWISVVILIFTEGG